MKTYSFAHRENGLFSGQILTTNSPEMVEANTPADHIPVEGAHDAFCRRFNHGTGEVEDYQPPAPSADHDWNGETRRWVVNHAVAARISARQSALSSIEQLERRMLRPLRELTLDPSNAEARARLEAIEAEIAEHRTHLQI